MTLTCEELYQAYDEVSEQIALVTAAYLEAQDLLNDLVELQAEIIEQMESCTSGRMTEGTLPPMPEMLDKQSKAGKKFAKLLRVAKRLLYKE